MPKVLRIINRFNLGGPTYNVAYLTKYLDSKFETRLIGGIPDEGETLSSHILVELDVKAQVLSSMKRKPSLKSDLQAYREIKKIIAEFKPDIVHTHASKAGALGRWAALRSGVPVLVHTYHGHVFDGYFGKIQTTIYKTIERFLADKTDGIIAISPEQKYDLTQKYRICPPRKVRVIPLGFDLSRFEDPDQSKRRKWREHWAIEEDHFAIGIIGRLAPIKNHAMFFEMLEELQKLSDRKFKVFIVGDGSERQTLEQLVSHLNFSENIEVIFTSWVNKVEQILLAMDVVCLTSNNEGTPVSLIEACAAGVPVISTDVGGVKHVVEDEENGFLVPKGDAGTMADKLLILIENKGLRETMSRKARISVRQKFHFQNLVDNMGAFYDELLEQKKILK